METVEVVPIIRPVEHVDRRCVVLEAAHGEGFLADAQTPVFVDGIVEIQEIGVVEEGIAAWVGHHSLTEIVGQLRGKVASHVDVKVLPLESIRVIVVRQGKIGAAGHQVMIHKVGAHLES